MANYLGTLFHPEACFSEDDDGDYSLDIEPCVNFAYEEYMFPTTTSNLAREFMSKVKVNRRYKTTSAWYIRSFLND